MNATCAALTATARAEGAKLLDLKFSISAKDGKISGPTADYEAANAKAKDAVLATSLALGNYKSAGGSLSMNPTFERDLSVLPGELVKLEEGLKQGTNPYTPWDQLDDYATNASTTAQIACPGTR